MLSYVGIAINKEIGCRLLEKDPYHLTCMPLHIGAALELGRKNELFLRAHNLVQEYPNK
jgi:anaphase-promoting complex subunit 6